MLEYSLKFRRGYVATPLLEACFKRGLFGLLNDSDFRDVPTLVDGLQANANRFSVAMDVLASLGWIDGSAATGYRTTEKAIGYFDSGMSGLYAIGAHSLIADPAHAETFSEKIRQTFFERKNGVSHSNDAARGSVVVPLFLSLASIDQQVFSKGIDAAYPHLTDIVVELFRREKWLANDGNALTEEGRALLSQANGYAELCAYGSMFGACEQRLFGPQQEGMPAIYGARENSAAWSSAPVGFVPQVLRDQALDDILELFDREPVESQPQALVDARCGRAESLKAIHDGIRDRTVRGKRLDRDPLRIFGFESSRDDLAEAESSMAGLPFSAGVGSYADAGGISDYLQESGVAAGEYVLHLRNAVDQLIAMEGRQQAVPSLEVLADDQPAYYLDSEGRRLSAAGVLAGWQRHLRGIAGVLGNSRLLTTQVHAGGMSESEIAVENTFDACMDGVRRLAHEYPISAEAYIVLAASVGLFNEKPVRRVPNTPGPCRFTLHHLIKRDYLVRHATLEDLERLCELEKLCWAHTRTQKKQIRARLRTYPEGQFVLEKNGVVLGVVFSQRIASESAIDGRTAADVHALHDPSGSVIQLLAVNIDPEAQNLNYGDQLLEFMLQRCALVRGIDKVVGVTLCKNYDPESGTPFETYIRQQGADQDAVLTFHESHGAEIVKPIPGYRPQDRANLHNGVLVAYDILHRVPRRLRAKQDAAAGKPRPVGIEDATQLLRYVQSQVVDLLGLGNVDPDMDQPVMEMGLDSANLLQLQQRLEDEFRLELDAGFFFEFSSIRKVVLHLASMLGVAADPVMRKSGTSGRDGYGSTAPHGESAAGERESLPENAIAIVGMSCKLPGGIESPDQFWRVLASGECMVGKYQTFRGAWPSGQERPGIDLGGFVEDAGAFDASFFRISPAEALITDPQQRMLLELAWGCVEDAGIVPAELKGSNTGVFIGASNCDYSRLVQESGYEVEAHHGVGTSLAVLANRISYFHDLSGPSLLIDTACSSSLVAMHAAIHSLRKGECAAAFVGGVNLICHPDLSIAYHKAGMLSADGRCKVFDAGANGYVRSEGAVMLLLKPLHAAIADDDQIHAVVRGSAINHGGLAGGLTVPNPQKQSELLVAAWRDAGIAPQQLSYLEAHGTGTPLGDPIEIQGIQSAFALTAASASTLAGSCAIGSTKSNLGHLESAAGVAGLLKVVLSMKHRQLPASINFERLNPKIKFDGTRFHIQEAHGEWVSEHARIAGVSSFGSGGTNAHVVVQEYRREAISVEGATEHLFVLSAANEERLKAYAGCVVQWLDGADAEDRFADAVYSWQIGRTAMRHRLAIRTSGSADLRAKLRVWIDGNDDRTSTWSGKVDAQGANANRAWTTTSGKRLVEQALADADLEQIGVLWASGIDMDWSLLHGETKRRRISLPTYPFAKEHHWIGTSPTARRNGAVPVQRQSSMDAMHPLLHRNTSDLSRQSYASLFSGDEFFLSDHRVGADSMSATAVLPAVAYLEMARAAIEQALPDRDAGMALELRGTVWVQPIFVTGDRRVGIALSADADHRIEYEIYSGSGEQEEVHCTGTAALCDPTSPARLDPDDLYGRPGMRTLQSETFYAAFAAMGLHYGAAHQVVAGFSVGETLAVAHLKLPAVVEDTLGSYVLHPAMMDGALQAATGLLIDLFQPPEKPSLPFSLETVRILAPTGTEMLACVRYAPGSRPGDNIAKLDIDLCDIQGNICVQMHGFSSRMLGKSRREETLPEATGDLLAAPVWEARIAAPAVPETQYAAHVVLLCELSGVDAGSFAASLPQAECIVLQGARDRTLAQRYSEYALICFEKVRALLKTRPAGKVLVQIVVPDSAEQRVFAGLSGLLKTATLENPQFVGQTIVVPAHTKDELLQYLLTERAFANTASLRYDGGVRQVLRWQEMPRADLPAPPLFKDGGVYLVTGGLGGLGMLFAKQMLQTAREATVVLTGRAALNDDRSASLAALMAQGGRAAYRQVELDDLPQVERLIASIQTEYGRLDGIVHSAGMVSDNFILKKSAEEFAAVLAPKVTGASHLDEASRDVALDFFVMFSSIVGVLGNLGQSDYAAANGFMDRFAAYRNGLVATGRRQGRTLSIDWPLWQDGGMRIDQTSLDQLRRTIGMQPMRTQTGLQAFHRSLAAAESQVLVMEGDLSLIRRSLLPEAASSLPASSSPSEVAPAAAVAVAASRMDEHAQDFLRRQFSEVLKLPMSRIDAKAALEEYGIDSILAMKLTSTLEEIFGVLPKTLFFEYQTIRDMAGYFVEQHGDRLSALLIASETSATAHTTAMPTISKAASVSSPEQPRSFPGRRLERSRSLLAGPAQKAAADPIAIVGLSGRYPQAIDLEAYWRNLRDGKDCIVEVPKERWDWRDYFSEDRTESGRHYSKWGGFIEGVDEFDPMFFNIAPREAKFIDPQERIFLQHAWMAIEDAGYTRASLQIPEEQDLAGQVGVYVGVMFSEYQLFGTEVEARDLRMGFSGNLASIANRVSYAMNLHGPSMTLDTMCSSSLTAIHVACQDLKSGRTSLAIAGGVNVTVHPNKYLMLSLGQFISSDGHCQSFGEGGDGYIPAEGVGAVVLKRLSEAQRDGDHVYGVIRGSALNHGGKTNGYTVPNPQAQAGAISRALKESRIDARQIGYIEAHGTGTKLGDPIEIAALNKAFQSYTQDTGFCLIGSAKSNIGHCESAAGIAGLTKVLLQMRHRQIVPSLHSARLNPHIDFDKSPFVVNQSLRDWDAPVVDGRVLPRIAGLSSFGAGGSNAHMLIEEYILPVEQPVTHAQVVVVLSARTSEQLQQKARELLAFVRSDVDAIDLTAMAYTLQVGREAMDERLSLVVDSAQLLAEKLSAYVAGEEGIDECYQGQVKRNREALALFGSDTDLQQAVEKWIANRKLSKLAELWTKGLDVDWAQLYAEARPRRISLPTYPFAKERYWIDLPANGRSAATRGATTAMLHPLLHSNTSDFGQQRYSATFTGDEPFLTDHQPTAEGRANGKVLPAAACLEMARAAIQLALSEQPDAMVLELRDTVWAQPVVVSGTTQVDIALSANDDNSFDFEIYSGAGEQEIVHCQGRAEWTPAATMARRDLAQLRAQATDSNQQRLVELRLPAGVESAASGFVLPPSLLDSALRSAQAMLEDGGNTSRQMFALETLRLVSPCAREMWAWARYASGSQAGDATVKLDIDLFDAQGNLCVEMQGAAWQHRVEIEVGEAYSGHIAAAPAHIATSILIAAPSAADTSAMRSSSPRRVAFLASKPSLQTPAMVAVPAAIALSAPVEKPMMPTAVVAKPVIVLGQTPVVASGVAEISRSVSPVRGKSMVDLGKPGAIALSMPAASISTPAAFAARAPVVLSNAAIGAPVEKDESGTSAVDLFDNGDGLFSIRIAVADGDNVLSETVVDHLLQALTHVRQDGKAKVLTLSGTTRSFLRGGREAINAALPLYRAIVAFPCPVIAVVQGEAAGAGLLAAALCDLMICSEEAVCGFTDPAVGLYPVAAEASLFASRFGEALAQDLLYVSTNSTGLQLRAKGLTCAIVPAAQVDAQLQTMVSALVTKSALALRLLKQHLVRPLSDAVDGLSRIEVPAESDSPVSGANKIASPSKRLQVAGGADGVLQVRLLIAGQPVTAEALLSDLGSVFAKLRKGRAYKAVVLSSDGPEFLPGSLLPEAALLDFQRLLAESSIPVVVALEGGARGGAWLMALCGDACVYRSEGLYAAAQIERGALSRLASALFPHRFGTAAGQTLLLGGGEHTGAELQRYVPSLNAVAQDQVLPTAMHLAQHWANLPKATLAEWKARSAATINARLRAIPVEDTNATSVDDAVLASIPEPARIALNSEVVAVTAHPDGVVVVKMEDRQAKNMFSDAFMAGVEEAFAHIERTPGYKAVVLTGYDNYFSSGGTKDNLLAIHAGQAKFTDYRIFESARTCRLPVVAAVQGHGIGAGWTLGMFADAVILSEESRYVSPYMNYGFTPGAGATWILADKLGQDLSRESLLTAQYVSGHELKARGAGLTILPKAEVLAAAMVLAQRMVRASRGDLIALKRQLTAGDDAALEAAYRQELSMHDETFVGKSDTLAQIERSFETESHPAMSQPPVSHRPPAAAEVRSVARDGVSEVASTLRTLLANELHLGETDIDDHAQFVDLGLDSISGVTWIRRINEHYGTSIEATKVYSYPTLAQLARHVREQSGQTVEVANPVEIVEMVAIQAPSPAPTVPTVAVRDGQQQIAQVLKTLLSNELHLDEGDIDENVQFIDLGLDSISGVTWIRRINAHYGTSIEATKVYSYPTLAQLARHVRDEIGKHGEPSTATVATSPAVVDAVAASASTSASTGGDVLAEVLATLRTLLANELHLREAEIDDNAQFIDLGLDSISGVTWVRKINETYGASIEATRIYSYPTLIQLGRYVREEAGKLGTLPMQTVLPTAETTSAPIRPAPAAVLAPRSPVAKLASRRGRKALRLAPNATARSTQSVAIIGMAGQFPQARNVDEFWQNLSQGRNCITSVPLQRWDMAAYYQRGEPVPGKSNSQWMGALEEYDLFDPLFFNISPTEAEHMDPQQRLFLQACWQGIEDAGYNAQALSGSKCGVFVGCTNGDYHQLSREHQLSAQGFTGGAISILAARISYFLNLQGPCVSIDTACSSSLVAIAQACDSLANGASDLALAGGVYVMASPEMHIKASQAGMLSAEGGCFTFDQRADGFVPGECVAVVMLKRLEDAERDRDNIVAVIEGWGVNQDGKTNGITAPNPESQSRLERDIYDKYRIDPAGIQLIEAHGTGTKLGDPIEVEGLKQAFGNYTQKQGYCALGSVKSNIGHCATAAGIAGVVKLVLALKHRQLPPTINFERLNEHIDLAGSPFYINDRLLPWQPHDAQKRRAAVSSFGFSGTNAHVVMAEYVSGIERRPRASVVMQDGRLIVPLSAKTPDQLRQKARELCDFLRSGGSQTDLVEMAYTLQVGREAMDERVGFLAATVEELAASLQAYADGEQRIKDCYRGQVKSGKESMSIIAQDDDIHDAVVDKCIATKKLSKLLEMWVKGLEFDWNRLYGDAKPQRIALPVYPFAKERYWIDAAASGQSAAHASRPGAMAALHPLLHSNTSDLSGQRYSSTFDGDEFFLADHQVDIDGLAQRKVLPGVAYLEMARAAIEQALPERSDSLALELRNAVWAQPVIVSDPARVHISLSSIEDDLGDETQVEYEIHSGDASRDIVHGQGRAVFVRRMASTKLDIGRLQLEMDQGRLEAAAVYAAFAQMGLHYGPAHRGIETLLMGEGQALAHLRLPAVVDAGHEGYVLHPSMMDSALQASVSLVCDLDRLPDKPLVPFAMDMLRVLSPCVPEMLAWVRYSPGAGATDRVVKLDVDLCDAQGNVCVQIRGFATRVLDGAEKSAGSVRRLAGQADDPLFDSAYYETLIENVAKNRMSVDDAVEVG